jgi:cytochrome c553
MRRAAIVAVAVALAGPGDALRAATFAERVRVCEGCHGADGNSTTPGSPSLAGQPQLFIETQLVLIREGVRPVAAMQGLLDGVGDAELASVARHFAQRPARSTLRDVDERRARRGQAIAEREQCGSCHLPRYQGQSHVPRLAAQREDYLVHAMLEFKANRAAGRDTMMSAVLHGLSEQDVGDVAHYLATLR